MEVRRRAPRTTRLQYEIIIDFLEKNEDLFTCEKNVDHFVKIQNKWTELAQQLNSNNVGPQKSIKDWKNVSVNNNYYLIFIAFILLRLFIGD